MKAIGITRSFDVDHADAFVEFESASPEVRPHDLLISVEAVSFNPLDVKMRQRAAKDIVLTMPKILGWDGVGVVREAGTSASNDWIGQRVLFTGDITRQGCNAELVAVDSRGVARAPKTWSVPEAASLPLAGVTSYEAIFDRLELGAVQQESRLLVIGGAGGVGSMAIQLARLVPDCTVIATASRSASEAWCRSLGADHVIDHGSLEASYENLRISPPTHILNCANTDTYWNAMSNLLAPRGRICSIVENHNPVDLKQLMRKSATFSWEHMNTSQLAQEAPESSATALRKICAWAEEARIKPTVTLSLQGLTAENLREAHAALETGQTLGKIVMSVSSHAK